MSRESHKNKKRVKRFKWELEAPVCLLTCFEGGVKKVSVTLGRLLVIRGAGPRVGLRGIELRK